MFWDLTAPFGPDTHQTWLPYDFAWLAKCDALLRLPGESVGADREIEEARRLGIPIFYGIAGLRRHYGLD